MTDTSKNTFQPDKFKVVIHKFPELEIFAQSVPIPSFTTDFTHVSTGASHDYYEIGDKIKYSDFTIEFILDEDMKVFEEIYNWSVDAVTKSRKDFSPFSDMTIMIFTNNSNKNFSYVLKNSFPYHMEGINMTSTMPESGQVVMTVTFKYSHYEVRR